MTIALVPGSEPARATLSLEDRFRALPGIDLAALDRGIAVAARAGERLDRVLLRLGLLDEKLILQTLCAHLSVPFLDTSNLPVDRDVLAALSPAYCAAQRIVPLLDEVPVPLLAMADPGDQRLRDEIAFHLDRPISVAGATTAMVRQMLASATDARDDVRTKEAQAARDSDALRATEADGPVIRFVNEKLTDAVLQGASDVHVECTEAGLDIRYRVNGILVPQTVDPAISVPGVIARLKVLAGVNVAERRLPQDGRFTVMIAGRTIDFRFSSLPTQWGESIVARVLDPKALRLGWDALGFPGDIVARVRAAVERPSGLFLVTGPTGSGKTTTLYTALAHLNTPARKIVTVEDPVEYNLPGVQQVQVNEAIGLTFARVLRGILRHDPNVILIGEIRDEETAAIAVRAAQVGRMVLSTLHTASAAGAVTRLVDLGVPEFLVRDVLRGVLGQELVPVACPSCGGAGCGGCGGTGVAGRRVVGEMVG